jgi:RND family efflux transporter MFP subunit
MTEPKLAWLLRRIRRSAVPADGHVGDAELLQRFTESGDPAAFELIVWRHQRLVFGVCRRVLRDFHDAEDALQATFLILARKAHSIGRREALAGWLYRVAYRVASAARQGRARRRQLPLSAAAEVARMPSLEDPAEQAELWAAIDDEVSRLPAKFRTATVLCYLQGQTVDEVARQLGCPRGTVASRLARARERLRGRLIRRGITLTAGAVAATLSETVASGAAPDRLIEQTVRAVRASASGGLGVSTQVNALTQEVLRMMLIKKIATSGVLLLAFAGTFLLGAGVAVRVYAGDGTEPKPVAENPQAPTGTGAGEKERAAPSEPLPVTVAQPVRREFTPYQDFVGHLEKPQPVALLCPANGYVVRKAMAQPTVKKGDVLFEYATREEAKEVFRLQDELQQIEQNWRPTDANLKKARKLLAEGTPAQKELDKRIKEAEVPVKNARDALNRAKEELKLTKVLAPVTGKIDNKDGTFVLVGNRYAVYILPPDTIGLRFDMDERTYLQFRRLVAAGQLQAEGSTLSVGMSDEEGFPQQAVLQQFDEEFNPAKGTIGVHCRLPDPDHLRLPGMYARVRIAMGKPRPVLEVPHSAVRPDGQHVWVVNKQNVVEERAISSHETDGKMWVIDKGLQPDDWVILSIPDRLQPGTHVDPRPLRTKPD